MAGRNARAGQRLRQRDLAVQLAGQLIEVLYNDDMRFDPCGGGGFEQLCDGRQKFGPRTAHPEQPRRKCTRCDCFVQRVYDRGVPAAVADHKQAEAAARLDQNTPQPGVLLAQLLGNVFQLLRLNRPGSDGGSVLSGGWRDGPIFEAPS